MREPSLRPERSASANSATSAFFVRTEFYLKDWFCQPDRRFELSFPVPVTHRAFSLLQSPPPYLYAPHFGNLD